MKTASKENEQASFHKESVQVPDQSETIPSVEVETQLAHEPADEVSLANFDEFLKLVTEAFQYQILIEKEFQSALPVVENFDDCVIPYVQMPVQQAEMSILSVLVKNFSYLNLPCTR